jgi:His-Xaa-Ser system radical SAM maturase HxsB
MSFSTADRTLELIFRSPSPGIKIEFQGGEPLLNFDLVKYIVREAKRINVEANRDLEFVIATNLALVNDEILDFCKAHQILISTSLDGPKALHNKNRPRPGGDSYQRTIDGILKARDVLGKDRVSALMTTSPASIGNVKSIIDEYVALDFDGIFLRSLSPYGFAVKTGWFQSYSTDRWLEFYKEGLEYIIELNKKGIFFVEQHAATLLTKLLTPFDAKFVDLMNPSGIGIAGVIYNYDGDVYPSDEARMIAEMDNKIFRMGNVNNNTYEEIFLNDTFLEALESSFTLSAPMCTDCAYEPFCGADPVYHYQTQGDFVGHKPSSGFCKKNMSLLQILIRKLDEDREVRRILYSWIGN